MLAVLWDDGYWCRFHISILNATFLAAFPVFCFKTVQLLREIRFESVSVKMLLSSVLYLGLALFVMWTDHRIRAIYMDPEKLNIDRSIYYLVITNIVALSIGSWKEKGCTAVILNTGALMLSPLKKELGLLAGYISAAYPWEREARYYNSLVFISETYGVLPMILMIFLLLMICVMLFSKREEKPVSDKQMVLRLVAIGYGIRTVLILLPLWFTFPHSQISFPFCGTGVLDLVVIWILLGTGHTGGIRMIWTIPSVDL